MSRDLLLWSLAWALRFHRYDLVWRSVHGPEDDPTIDHEPVEE
jgi:hypothetical protein